MLHTVALLVIFGDKQSYEMIMSLSKTKKIKSVRKIRILEYNTERRRSKAPNFTRNT